MHPVIDPTLVTLAIKNYRTFLTGLVSGFVVVMLGNGFNIPQTTAEWQSVALATALIAFGIVAKDARVSSLPQGESTAPVTLPTAGALTATIAEAKAEVKEGAPDTPLKPQGGVA